MSNGASTPIDFSQTFGVQNSNFDSFCFNLDKKNCGKNILKERARKDRQAEQETRTTQQEIKPETTRTLRL